MTDLALTDDTDLVAAKRQLLLAAVADIGRSVKANDQKASAALVVHGLLFAGILTIVSKLGSTYRDATTWQQDIGLALLGVALAAFLISVGYLLMSLRPYRPTDLEKKMECRYKRVFFPREDDLNLDRPFEAWRDRVNELDKPDDILDTLTAEILKLGKILDFESAKAKVGYYSLFGELVAVAAFFVLAAGVLISRV